MMRMRSAAVVAILLTLTSCTYLRPSEPANNRAASLVGSATTARALVLRAHTAGVLSDENLVEADEYVQALNGAIKDMGEAVARGEDPDPYLDFAMSMLLNLQAVQAEAEAPR